MSSIASEQLLSFVLNELLVRAVINMTSHFLCWSLSPSCVNILLHCMLQGK